jgi:inosine/guanosine/xanthosine phosphorylase family protein
MDKVVLPVKIMALMGVKLLIVTNAAGGLNPEFNVGDIMIIQDHFGLVPLSGHNPLRGVNDDATGPRFPSLSDAYDSELQTMVVKAAHTLGLQHKMRSDGTYCFVSGPCYETRAEARLLQTIGGDAVGASTCPECITAKRCGMRVLGLSLITNKVVLTTGKDVQHASHAEVLQAVSESGSDIASILKEIITTDVLGTYVEKIKPLRCSMYTRESKEQQSDIEDMPTTPLGGTMGTEDLSLKSDPQSDLKIDPKSDPKYDAQGRGDGNSSIFSAASQDQRNGEEDNDDLLVYPNEYSDIYCNLLILLGVASVISLCYHLKL